MQVVRPTKNPLTGGYTSTHKGYDHAGLNLPDEVVAGKDGAILTRVDAFNTSWINNGALTIRDYGNFIIIKHTDGTFELHAHLKQGSSLTQGTQVKAGQVVARIGNTGNSTGPHIHSEYRNIQNVNVPVEFIDSPLPTTPPMNDKRPGWFDLLSKTEFGTTGWEKLTDAQINKWVSDLNVRKVGNGKWDFVAQSAGLPTSSTPEAVVVKLAGTAFDKNKFLEGVKKLLFG